MHVHIKEVPELNRLEAWRRLPEVTSPDGAVYLVARAKLMGRGDVDSVALGLFQDRLEKVLELGPDIIIGKLAPILVIPLAVVDATRRVALAAYMISTKSKKQLNEVLGGDWFVEEGSLGDNLSVEVA